MNAKWLYQVRIRVNSDVSNNLRTNEPNETTEQILAIAKRHGTRPVCTYDAFCDYCSEAEANGIEKYSLYEWTKQTIENQEKKEKHIKSFAFYKDNDQIYEETLAVALHEALLPLKKNGATDVYVFITHAVLSGDAANKIKKSKIKKLVITDSIDNSQKIKNNNKIEVLSISSLMAEAIKRISNSTSVSDLFN